MGTFNIRRGDETMTPKEIKRQWVAGNELGEGFDACGCGLDVGCSCDINSLTGLGRLERPAGPSTDSVALYVDEEGSYVAVGDLGGPWAVYLPRTYDAHVWFEQFDGDAVLALANAEEADARIEQDWDNGATILTFSDCSSVIFEGPSVTFEEGF